MSDVNLSIARSQEEFDEKCYESVIDPITGEIINNETTPVGDTQELEKFARIIRAINRKMLNAKTSLDNQIALAKQIYNSEIEKLESQRDYFIKTSMFICEANNLTDYKSQVGKFRWQKQQPQLDTEAFDKLTEEAQQEIYKKFPELFRVTVSPDKTKIKSEINADADVPSEFRLLNRESKFVFAEAK